MTILYNKLGFLATNNYSKGAAKPTTKTYYLPKSINNILMSLGEMPGIRPA